MAIDTVVRCEVVEFGHGLSPPTRGAYFRNAQNVLTEGLSPPTRGSRSDRHGSRVVDGSIPAHAGEPAEA